RRNGGALVFTLEVLTGHHGDHVREGKRVGGALGLSGEGKVRIVCENSDRPLIARYNSIFLPGHPLASRPSSTPPASPLRTRVCIARTSRPENPVRRVNPVYLPMADEPFVCSSLAFLFCMFLFANVCTR
ncbi:hypothetical protein ALC53_11826, partial [Atta colombica]